LIKGIHSLVWFRDLVSAAENLATGNVVTKIPNLLVEILKIGPNERAQSPGPSGSEAPCHSPSPSRYRGGPRMKAQPGVRNPPQVEDEEQKSRSNEKRCGHIQRSRELRGNWTIKSPVKTQGLDRIEGCAEWDPQAGRSGPRAVEPRNLKRKTVRSAYGKLESVGRREIEGLANNIRSSETVAGNYRP
jgi:hypothetical protein